MRKRSINLPAHATRTRRAVLTAAAVSAGAFATVLACPAQAYVGPGAGLGVLGALLAILLAVLATVVGVVLWPVRAIMRWWKARHGTSHEPQSTSRARH